MEKDEGNKREEGTLGKNNAGKVPWVTMENKLDLHVQNRLFKMPAEF